MRLQKVVGVRGCVWLLGVFSLVPLAWSADSELDAPTHRQAGVIRPLLSDKPVTIHTFCVLPDGLIVAACEADDGSGWLIKLDSAGENQSTTKLDFVPTAVNVAPDGTLFVAGAGKLVRLSAAGELLATGESPTANASQEELQEAVERAQEQAKEIAEMYQQQEKMIKDQINKLEAKEDLSHIDQARLSAYKDQLEMYESVALSLSVDPDEIKKQTLQIPSIAVGIEDVFVTCRTLVGYGYEIWRTNYDFSAPEKIVDSVSGCCGQMDIQCCGDQLVIAENTAFKVGFYDRDGNPKHSFGQRDRSSQSGFGSCCNPMNVRAMADGSLLTAESSIGHIKRFSQDGKLVAYVGKARIGAGCKHCAVGYDATQDLYYLMYEDQNEICVLANQKVLPEQTEDEKRIAALRSEFETKLLGKWQVGDAQAEEKKSGLSGLISGIFGVSRTSSSSQPFDSLEFHPDGSLKANGGQYASQSSNWAWEPISGDGNKVKLSLLADQVETLTVSVEFKDANRSEFVFDFYGQIDAIAARRVADCNGKPCDEECVEQANAATTGGSDK